MIKNTTAIVIKLRESSVITVMGLWNSTEGDTNLGPGQGFSLWDSTTTQEYAMNDYFNRMILQRYLKTLCYDVHLFFVSFFPSACYFYSQDETT